MWFFFFLSVPVTDLCKWTINKITWPNFKKIQVHQTISTSSVILPTSSETVVFIEKTYLKKSVFHKRGIVWIRLDKKTLLKGIINSFCLDTEIIIHAYFRRKWMYGYIKNIWYLSVVIIYLEVQIHFPPVLHRGCSDHLISPSEH